MELTCFMPPATGSEAKQSLFLFSVFFNFFKSIESAFVYSGTFLRGTVPIVWTGQITRPEGPGSTLHRPDVINRTAFRIIYINEEDAILCLRIFLYRYSKAEPSQIFFVKLRDSYFKMLGEFFDFRFRYPYNAFFRAGAASATLLTGEMKTADVPNIFRHRFHRFIIKIINSIVVLLTTWLLN